MKTFNENASILNFDAWSGAVETKKAIIDACMVDEFDALIEELYPDGLIETQLNDILWFDSEWCFDSLGMANYNEDTDEDETDEDEE